MASKSINIFDILNKKSDGSELEDEEIQWFVKEASKVTNSAINDSQIGAMLMAIKLNKMTPREAASLTKSMTFSGTVLQWPEEWQNILVDKHSTGGVGDKVSLVLAPALAVFGLKVPMISGRGLGHTGGTLDKLESIEGFQVQQSEERIREIVEQIGCCIVGQTKNIAPCDKKLYAIRDVTATVNTSILSKKAAAGIKTLVMEMTYGEGALIKTRQLSEELAREIVKFLFIHIFLITHTIDVGKELGMNIIAAMTKMVSPIGKTIGNAIEVLEAVDTLNGKGPKDLIDVVCKLGACLLQSTNIAKCFEEAEKMMRSTLNDNSAAEKFRLMIIKQGVDAKLASQLMKDPREVLKLASRKTEIKSNSNGIVNVIRGLPLAKVLREHHAGRFSVEDQLDYKVGIEILKDEGDKIEKGWLFKV
ncbi:DgyrCDS5723 [Dimorphilus gyrociliatus]|uniref:Thymidine phosphorylase n=1 Tax=Dimorphilus gyrociliatus TaxID=2664684 RepID=A0A7I8VKW2_9ANNE|nr:DgyrCDS5723 [Dimorphilus gyrociliatus]